jgi:hypothetical protein
MRAPSKPVLPPVYEDKPLPVVTFKTSLREWRAQYKARRATQAADAAKGENQTAPA